MTSPTEPNWNSYDVWSRRKEFSCKRCRKAFNNKKKLDEHEREHEHDIIERLFKCDSCGDSFTKKGNMSRHFKKQHGSGPTSEQSTRSWVG